MPTPKTRDEGLTQSTQKEYTGAEAEIASVLQRRQQILGAEHPNTLHTSYLLARIYKEQGKPEEARITAQHIVEKARKIYGNEHATTKHYESFLRQLPAAK